MQLATRAIKEAHPELLVITDVCLCEYTDHGHCGVVRDDGEVDNDATLELLARTAISQAARRRRHRRARRHDGRARAARSARSSTPRAHADTPIMAYSAKFASAFYGPFREAAELGARVRRPPRLPDGSGQRRRGRARGAAGRGGGRGHGDGQAGAPLPRRDPAGQGRDAMPVAAYNVSGEYAMVKAAAAARLARRARAVLEIAHRHPPRRRRHDHHLPRQGRRAMASDELSPTAQAAQPQARRGGPARRARQASAEPHAGLLPARAAALRARRGARPRSPRRRRCARRSACWTSGSSARSRRSSTRARSATRSMLVAAKVDPEQPAGARPR